MALVVKDRVQETTGVTGTGTMTLGGAVLGFQTFGAIGDANNTYYAVVDVAAGMWEVGYGTYTASGTTLTRTFVYASSNAGALVDFAAGTKNVFCTYPAEQAIYQELDGSLKLVGGQITLTLDGTLGTTLPNSTFQAFATLNDYIQTNQQNLSSGAEASSNTVLTADNGTDTTNYVDFGIASSGYNSTTFPALLPNSGFLISTGADLRIQAGTNGATVAEDKDIVFNAGLLTLAGERMRIKGLSGNIIIDAIDPTDTGEKLQVYGSAKITGATEFGSTVLLSANPTLALQATTKQYVDGAVATGFVVHDPVLVATTAALPANTYANGTLGVGATLTANANGALTVDTVLVASTNRVLVKDETASANNGVYTVTAAGDGSNPYVLTRATDFDQAAAGEIANNAYFFVSSGSTGGNKGSAFIMSQLAAITVGTTALPFTRFSEQLTYVGSTNIDVTGLTISLTGTVPEANGGTGISSYAVGDITYATGSTTLSKLAIGTIGQTVISGGTAPQWGALDLAGVGVAGTLPATKGGTAQSAYAVGDMLYSSATNTLTKLPGNTTTNKLFLGQTGTGATSAAPIWQQPAAGDITGLAASATTDTTNAANISSGTLPTGRISGSYTGITGTGALAAGSLASGFAAVSAPLGGTGQTSYAVGDLIYANTTTSFAKLADVAVGNALISGGVGSAPSYGKIGLATHVSGTLPVANGGTGATTLTANNVLLGNGTSAVQVVAPGASGNVLKSNGTTWTSAAAGASLSGQTDSASPFETSLGFDAGAVNTGVRCTFIGYNAGKVSTSGRDNTFIGESSGSLNTTGFGNTALGSGALLSSSTARDSVAIGIDALRFNTTGSYNVANGSAALLFNSGGSSNTAIGAESLFSNTTGTQNSAVGRGSLVSNTSGLRNVSVGYRALESNTTGSGNTTLNPGSSSSEHSPVFNPTTEDNRFCMGSTGVTNAYIQVAWTVVSDARDKTDFTHVPHGLDFVTKLNPIAYRYKAHRSDSTGHGPLRYGFKAQEVLALEGDLPVVVDAEDLDKLRFNDQSLIAILVKSIQELSAKVDALQAELNQLKGN